ncbi:LysR family transcriptional regulator [Novosphingobium sp. 9]|uniref:LysR family transcriptional regulator n=1 Tax=Novosphingobium sp. 9 TaxID=2025349 RepID=UPI0021B593F6|nr:LysR family transcriptional regulator [Novosphingobium sp. 9]
MKDIPAPWSQRATLRQLAIFEATAEAGTAGRAARRLRLSQPAVSHALARLDVSLGTPLIERSARGSALTAAGRILCMRVERMRAHLRKGLAAALVAEGDGDDDIVVRAQGQLTSTQVACHLAVASAGSFEAAAQELAVSPPAVNRVVHSLELLLGARLYRRSGRRFEVTRKGRVLANQLQLALAEIDQAQDDVEAEQGRGRGRVRIGVLPMTPSAVVGAAIGQLIARHPDVELRIEEGPYDWVAPQLRDGRIDLLFGAVRPERVDPDFAGQPLIDDPYVIVARAGHPVTATGQVCARMLSQQVWVVPSAASPRRQAIEEVLAALPSRPRVVLETSSEPMLMATLAASDCVTLGPRSQVQGMAAQPLLGATEFKGLKVQRSIGFTVRRDWLPTQIQRSMMALLEDCTYGLITGYDGRA